MQIPLKNIAFKALLVFCTSLSAQTSTNQFISLVSEYYKNMSDEPSFSSPIELAQIKTLLPEAQKKLRSEVTNQKKHAKTLKKATDETVRSAAEENIEKARLQLQNKLRESQDITPLKTAIAQAQWIISPQKKQLSKKALIAVLDSKEAQTNLLIAEEELGEAWEKLQQK